MDLCTGNSFCCAVTKMEDTDRYSEDSSAPPPKKPKFSLAALADESANEVSNEGFGEPVSVRKLKLIHQRTGERCWGCLTSFGIKPDLGDKHMRLISAMHAKMKQTSSRDYMYSQLSQCVAPLLNTKTHAPQVPTQGHSSRQAQSQEGVSRVAPRHGQDPH